MRACSAYLLAPRNYGALRHSTLTSAQPHSILKCNIDHNTTYIATYLTMASVLFMGVGGHDPNIDLPPNVTAQELDAAINKGVEAIKNAGYTVRLFMPPIMEGIAALEKELQTTKYDLVLVGVSVSHLLRLTARWSRNHVADM